MTTEDTIRRFIMEELPGPASEDELTDHYQLLDNGVIDSLGIFELVTFLERHFGVTIDDLELVPGNFRTIADIARMIDEKRAALA